MAAAHSTANSGSRRNNVPDPGDSLGEDWLILDPTSDLFGRTVTDREFAFTIGGPILQNKLWFYGAADVSQVDNKEPLWPVVTEGTNRYFDLKVSAEPAKNHTCMVCLPF